MADINDGRIIKFCNESIRPAAEKIRELDVILKDLQTKWNNEISFILDSAASDDVVNDGRTKDGVSVLTKNDVLLMMTQINTFVTQMDGVGVRNVINKPCVRPIQVI